MRGRGPAGVRGPAAAAAGGGAGGPLPLPLPAHCMLLA